MGRRNRKLDIAAQLIEKEEILPGIYRMCFETGEGFVPSAVPGTFVQIEVSPGPFPVTRRPFTISRISGSSIEIIFEVVGTGTELLASAEKGRSLRILGPLGHGYDLKTGGWLLIGGGLGAAGFFWLIPSIDCRLLLLGAYSTDRLLPFLDTPSIVITEDQSGVRQGLVTDLLDSVRWDDMENVAICGPVAMMKAVVRAVPPRLLNSTQISAESRMGCGWGGCEGCSIPAAAGGYLKCCTDGPVFPAESIDWDRWEGIRS